MALIIFKPLLWVLLAVSALLYLWLAKKRHLRWWPAWIIRMLLVIPILVGILYPKDTIPARSLAEREIMLVDQSSSLPSTVLAQLRLQAETWQQAGQNRLVIAFADHPEAVLDFGNWPATDGRSSDPAAALSLASSLLGKEIGKVVLVSSGRANNEAAVEAAISQLSRNGQTVDILPVETQVNPADGYVGTIQVPSYLWEGSPFEISLPVYSPTGVTPTLKLSINGKNSTIQPAILTGGTYRFTIPPQPVGMVTLAISASFTDDPNQTNNSTYAALQVFTTPRVLFVSANLSQDTEFINMLKRSGLPFDVQVPEKVPSDAGGLSAYKVVVLNNILAVSLNNDQIIALRSFVSEQAGGLIFLGGYYSYTLGGYKDSLLEPILPVKLEPPPRPQRPPTTFLLVLDHSGSMGIDLGGIQPLQLAVEAAMRAIENLKSEDYLGLLTFSDDATWDIPIRQVGDGLLLRQSLDTVSEIRTAGGTLMYAALQEAAKALASLPSSSPAQRHLLLLSDGNSADGLSEDFISLAQKMYLEYNTTVSTIALGPSADHTLLSDIAAAGKGRFYLAATANTLPKIMLDESRAGRGDNTQLGTTTIRLNEPNHPLLSGMSEADLPVLADYNALSSKQDQGAEDILVSSSFKDPILSAWQFGLGRVIAWMSDTGTAWTGPWENSANEQRFWTQVIRYALPNPAIGPIQAEVKTTETQLSVDVHLEDNLGQPANLAAITFSYDDTAGIVHSLPIVQTGPGAYHLLMSRLPDGAYRAAVTYDTISGQDQSELKGNILLPFAVNYVPDAQQGLSSPDQSLVSNWVKAGGGKILTIQDLFTAEQISPVTSASPSVSWLWAVLLALVISWPLEIALRRRWLSWK